MKKEKFTLKDRPKPPSEFAIVTGKSCYDYAEEWFKGLEAKMRNMDFSEWIQEYQEELPLGYSKDQLIDLFVKKEILGE